MADQPHALEGGVESLVALPDPHSQHMFLACTREREHTVELVMRSPGIDGDLLLPLLGERKALLANPRIGWQIVEAESGIAGLRGSNA